MSSVFLPLSLQPPPQTGLVIQLDFISRRVRRRRQQIHFFQSLSLFVLYFKNTPTRSPTWTNMIEHGFQNSKSVSATPERSGSGPLVACRTGVIFFIYLFIYLRFFWRAETSARWKE